MEESQCKYSLLTKPTTSFQISSYSKQLASARLTPHPSFPCILLLAPWLLNIPTEYKVHSCCCFWARMTCLGPQTCLVILFGSLTPHPVPSAVTRSAVRDARIKLRALTLISNHDQPQPRPHFSNTGICMLCPPLSIFPPKWLPRVSLSESLIPWDAMGFGVRQSEFHCYIRQGQQAETVEQWIWACSVVMAVQKSSEARWRRAQANPSEVLVLVGLTLYRCNWHMGHLPVGIKGCLINFKVPTQEWMTPQPNPSNFIHV